MLYFISGLMILFFCISFFQYMVHILNLLITLEAIMLSVLLYTYSFLGGGYTFLTLLTLAACEAAFGLSLLVSFIRLRGDGMMSSMSSLSW
uniref:NADH-ubiquinone oxidoreductase chain 4L n=1 Tax=Pyramidella dolabrata TaxID=252582 RepID=B3DFG0_9GAST|nr:NADH dehydrogenase subunit 4L [Pyramidella dolabrata]ACE62847.1 NADH dehydrogenase subunit 4L [Pyramidella dolabrata]